MNLRNFEHVFLQNCGGMLVEDYKSKIIELIESIENVKVLEIIYNCIVNVIR